MLMPPRTKKLLLSLARKMRKVLYKETPDGFLIPSGDCLFIGKYKIDENQFNCDNYK